jgi:hypothetical protein
MVMCGCQACLVNPVMQSCDHSNSTADTANITAICTSSEPLLRQLLVRLTLRWYAAAQCVHEGQLHAWQGGQGEADAWLPLNLHRARRAATQHTKRLQAGSGV